MKYKVLTLAVLSVIIYSCKSGTPAVAANETRPAAAPTPGPAPAPSSTTATATVMTPELAEGKELYDNNCAKCHRLYKADEFSKEEWKPIVDRMAKKAHLNDLQGQRIYNYITMN
jgi:cytochrome c5